MVAGCNIKKSHITMTIALLSALQFLNPIFVSNLSFISNSLPTNDISLDSIEDTIIQRAAAQEPSGGDSVASPEEEKDKDQGAMSPLDPGAVDENTPRAVQEGEDNPVREDDCGDGIDNDDDGLTDNEDTEDCVPEGGPFSGTGTIVREDNCRDGIDNDGDGLIDLEDVNDCASTQGDVQRCPEGSVIVLFPRSPEEPQYRQCANLPTEPNERQSCPHGQQLVMIAHNYKVCASLSTDPRDQQACRSDRLVPIIIAGSNDHSCVFMSMLNQSCRAGQQIAILVQGGLNVRVCVIVPVNPSPVDSCPQGQRIELLDFGTRRCI